MNNKYNLLSIAAIVFFFAPIVISCENISPKVEVIDEVYSPSKDSLYAICADLSGFGPFNIGKMTYKDYVYSKDITINKYMRYSSFYSGYWAQAISSDSDTRFALSKHLEKCGFKQVVFANISDKFIVGDVKLEKIDAVFWHDILVAIYVDLSFDDYDNNTAKLLSHYIDKYGNGEGKKYSYYSTNWTESRAKSNKVSSKKDYTEKHIWSNGDVSIEYYERDFFEIIEGTIQSSYVDEAKYYLITGSNYQAFMTALNDEVKSYLQSRDQKNAEALSAF